MNLKLGPRHVDRAGPATPTHHHYIYTEETRGGGGSDETSSCATSGCEGSALAGSAHTLYSTLTKNKPRPWKVLPPHILFGPYDVGSARVEAKSCAKLVALANR